MIPVLRKSILLICLFLVGDLVAFTILKAGMDHYYGMDKAAQVLCIGHSHTVLGIDARQLETKLNVPVAKYATAGANTLDRYWMIRQFVSEHPTVKAVVYDVEPRLFDSEGLSSASYTLFLPYMGNVNMAAYLKQQATWQEFSSCKLVHTARFRDQTINIALRGLFNRVENKKSRTLRVEDYANYLEREKQRKIRINPESLKCFRDSVALLTQKGIRVYLAFLPVTDLLNTIDPENQARVIDIFKDLAVQNENIVFLDYNEQFQHDYSLFYDLRHLNGKGNRIITDLLIHDLKI